MIVAAHTFMNEIIHLNNEISNNGSLKNTPNVIDFSMMKSLSVLSDNAPMNQKKMVIHSPEQKLNLSPLLGSKFSFENILSSIPLIVVGSAWGSGIVVYNDNNIIYIITCAHVINLSISQNVDVNKMMSKIRVKFYGISIETWIEANLIFISKSAIDLAILKVLVPQSYQSEFKNIQPLGLESHNDINFSNNTPIVSLRKGQQAYAIGHGLFRPSFLMAPTISLGIISKVISVDGEMIMIQTSCEIHSGFSGGALIDFRTGNILGMIIQNTVQHDGIVLSKLNCIGIKIFIRKYS